MNEEYTVDEASEMLGFNRQTITRSCKSGRLKAVKRKGWRISKEEVDRFLEQGWRETNG